MGFVDTLLQPLRRNRGDVDASDAPRDPLPPGALVTPTVIEIDAPDALDLQPAADAEPLPADRPRANPAFSEALFVELVRARQFHRAYEQLAPDCRSRWGDAERFADAQRAGGIAQVHAVSVRKVRHLEGWVDPQSGTAHRHCAELEVEYTVGRRDRQILITRTVHLVAEAGKWRSLCYPADAN